jgi:predicted ATPase
MSQPYELTLFGGVTLAPGGSRIELSTHRQEDRLIALLCILACLPQEGIKLDYDLSAKSIQSALGFRDPQHLHRCSFELRWRLLPNSPREPRAKQLDILFRKVHSLRTDLADVCNSVRLDIPGLARATRVYAQGFLPSWQDRWVVRARVAVDEIFQRAWENLELSAATPMEATAELCDAALLLISDQSNSQQGVQTCGNILCKLANALRGRRRYQAAIELLRKAQSRLQSINCSIPTQLLELQNSISTEAGDFGASELAGNLPLPVSPGIPRAAEIRRVLEPIRTEYRIVTITGLPGTGKSRLAIEAANFLKEGYYDRAWFVALDRLQYNQGIADLIALKLGARRRRQEDALDALLRFLRRKHLLLVLDDCESMVVEVAETVKQLVQASEHVRIIATCRQPLGIAEEKLVRLGGLDYPKSSIPLDVDAIASFPSVQLFLKRVSAKLEKFDWNILTARKVALITSLVEGNPLQIEIIARSVPGSSLDTFIKLLQANRSGFIKPLLDAVFRSLDPRAQTVLRRLCVFRGSWSLISAEKICAFEPLSPSDIPPSLQVLFDRGLIEQENVDRFHFLPVIRDYLLHLPMETQDGRKLPESLSAYILEFSKTIAAGALGDQIKEAVGQLQDEADNVRAALDWCIEERSAIGIEIVALLYPAWLIGGSLTEGRETIKRLLDRSKQRGPAHARAAAGAATLAFYQADLQDCLTRGEEALTFGREVADSWSIVIGLVTKGVGTFHLLHELDRARVDFDESVVAAKASGDAFLCELAISNAALHRVYRPGDPRPACELLSREQASEIVQMLDDSLRFAEAHGNHWIRSHCHLNRAATLLYLFDQDALPAVTEEFKSALHLDVGMNYKYGIVQNFGKLAYVALRQGRLRRGAKLLGAQNGLVADGPKIPKPEIDALESAYTESNLRNMLQQEFNILEAQGHQMRVSQSVAYALSDED